MDAPSEKSNGTSSVVDIVSLEGLVRARREKHRSIQSQIASLTTSIDQEKDEAQKALLVEQLKARETDLDETGRELEYDERKLSQIKKG